MAPVATPSNHYPNYRPTLIITLTTVQQVSSMLQLDVATRMCVTSFKALQWRSDTCTWVGGEFFSNPIFLTLGECFYNLENSYKEKINVK